MIWFVALGSALGGMARYLIGGLVQQASRGSFPLGTLVVNVSGSFLLGLLYRYSVESAAITPEVRTFLTIGLCGGYTTFSTFSYETVRLIEDGESGRAMLYVALSLLLSIGGMFLGLAAGRELLVLRRS
jgi:CrcB protein